jgi:hypothetical protein
MNKHEQWEALASLAMLDHAVTMAKRYTDNPGDVEAATKALLVATLERIFNRRINIEQITR